MVTEFELPKSGGFYKERNLPISHQELVNALVRVNQTPNGKSEESIYGGPGVKTFATLPAGPNRVFHEFNDKLYALNDETLYELSSDGSFTALGTIPGGEVCSSSNNGTQLAITRPGGASYIWDTGTSTLTEITTANFLGPFNTNLYKDNYLIFFKDDLFQVSNLGNGLVYTATDFGSSEVDPDDIVTGIVNKNQLFVFSRRYTAVFQNIGGSSFPFRIIPGSVIDYGIAGKFLVTDLADTFIWVGHGVNEMPSVYIFNNSTTPTRVSTPAIDEALASYTEEELELSYFFNFSIEGSFIAVLSLPRQTFFYDLTASQLLGFPVWGQRKSPFDQIWNTQGIVKVFGKILVANRNNGLIGELDFLTHKEYGDNFDYSFTIGPFERLNNRVNGVEIELDMVTGVGNSDDSDPVIYMSYSDNNYQFRGLRKRPLGGSGEYAKRVRFRRQGSFATNRVLKFNSSSPVQRIVNRVIARTPRNGRP
jgi:hypothetical protein